MFDNGRGLFCFWYIYIFWKSTQRNEICSHSSQLALKGRFFKPGKLQNHGNEGGEEKKAMVALLVFIIATLKFLDAKGPFGDNAIKNSGRYTFGTYCWISKYETRPLEVLNLALAICGLLILGDPGPDSRDDIMFVVKVYCIL